ncbi:hypothetical protein ACFC5Z_05945 [Streptomyces sp. NPDC056004]|uniref:hypothetical protein n=1 Tax=Streptomyces sp. NPDC056004 TaxID=3345677 RepID=UPI0035E21503
MLPHVYRVTKYDPADRGQHGHYIGAESEISDHGPVEAAYLMAVAAFAEDTGIDQLVVREPQIGGFAHFGLEPPVGGHGLAGLFPNDLAGFHDGAPVPVEVGLELVRAMLRDNGAWCRLEVDRAFSRCTSAGTSTSTWAAAGSVKRRWPVPAHSGCSRNAWTRRRTTSSPMSLTYSARPTPTSGPACDGW